MSPCELEMGMVVQLSPTECRNPMFAGCMLTVFEPKDFGCMGYVQALGQDGKMGGQAYYFAHWHEMELVGRAEWVAE